jgi:phosphoribosylglycinamide formyltransferase-1
VKKVVILISGSGSNLQSLIDNAKNINIHITAVISNQAEAYGLTRAKQANITTEVLLSNGLVRAEFDEKLAKIIDKYQPDLILLAGFMRILTQHFVTKYTGKILNIHPSLLPKFKGLNTHKRAIEAGEKIHGASVHLVNGELDGGKVILQKSLAVLPDDNADSLAKRVLKQEHILYPQAIQHYLKNQKI